MRWVTMVACDLRREIASFAMRLSDPVTRPFVLSVLGMFGTVALVVVGGIVLANKFHVDDSAATAVLGGVALLAVTVFRPTWFWWHAKVLFVRSIIGDKGAAAFYGLVSVGLVLYGVNGWAYWAAHAAKCSQQYRSATDSHQRMRILRTRPDTTLGGLVGAVRKPEPLTCDRYRERGAF